MVNEQGTNLGSALTALGLEDKFLSNGELAQFPLIERGRIANGIISEKLKLGRWESVVRMIYGGFGKADVLFEGDRDELKRSIVQSAVEDKSTYLDDALIRMLEEKGENDLLFTIATSLPLNDECFERTVRTISPKYFADPVEGPKKLSILNELQAKRAVDKEDYASAMEHLSGIKDHKKIEALFDKALSSERRTWDVNRLEKIAASDERHKEQRLRKMILSATTKNGINPLEALKLHRRHRIQLTDKQQENLYHAVAKKAEAYEIRDKLGNEDPALLLLWAKHHATTEPRLAYHLFSQLKYEGEEVITAVLAGLTTKSDRGEEKALDLSHVSKDHLRIVYEKAPFDAQVRIALCLGEKENLKELSRQAKQRGDLRTAYRLWFMGGGDPQEEEIDGIRKKLIQKELAEDYFTYFSFFYENIDAVGKNQAYTALIEDARKNEKPRHVYTRYRAAYALAFSLGDESRAQAMREQMVAIDPRQAISDFLPRRERTDEKGLNYAIDAVSQQFGTDRATLKRFVLKYQSE